MQILNIAGYKFIALKQVEILRNHLHTACLARELKGTILISHEGININLSGNEENIVSFKSLFASDSRFTDIAYKESYSSAQTFQRLKVKIKKEIITLRQPEVDAVTERAPSIAPELFKQWLDEKRDITVLDTRNDYEVRFGTFTGAVNPHLQDFSEFPSIAAELPPNKPIVMFCTGGIRCEKAALYLLKQGFSDVYQLDGGILNYFAKVGGDHYTGECFVFDERIAVDTNLQCNGTIQCRLCQGPVTVTQQASLSYMTSQTCAVCCPE